MVLFWIISVTSCRFMPMSDAVAMDFVLSHSPSKLIKFSSRALENVSIFVFFTSCKYGLRFPLVKIPSQDVTYPFSDSTELTENEIYLTRIQHRDPSILGQNINFTRPKTRERENPSRHGCQLICPLSAIHNFPGCRLTISTKGCVYTRGRGTRKGAEKMKNVRVRK